MVWSGALRGPAEPFSAGFLVSPRATGGPRILGYKTAGRLERPGALGYENFGLVEPPGALGYETFGPVEPFSALGYEIFVWWNP